jgi:hypothetical protein
MGNERGKTGFEVPRRIQMEIYTRKLSEFIWNSGEKPRLEINIWDLPTFV